MAQVCEVCGKKPVVGNTVTTRGRAKYLGGVGTKITGISRRQFKPNLRTVRISTPNGTHKRVRVCAKCLRSGAVTRVVRSAPFKLPPLPGQEKAKVESAQEKQPKKPKVEELIAQGYKVRKRKRKKGE
ncbi:MAG: 50S ribosomal protein L28 [Thermoguttaceae bacterium]|jgi:large subunit ribosomal protein L28|nr:50S ribosomal protein L28 [Thermoguttaceae bacterium]